MTEAIVLLVLKFTMFLATLAFGSLVVQRENIEAMSSVPVLMLIPYALLYHSDRLRRKRERRLRH